MSKMNDFHESDFEGMFRSHHDRFWTEGEEVSASTHEGVRRALSALDQRLAATSTTAKVQIAERLPSSAAGDALRTRLNEYGSETLRHSLNRIFRLLSAICEHPLVGAKIGAVFVLSPCGERLESVASFNMRKHVLSIGIDALGIVPHVFETRRLYYCGDTDKDRKYFEDAEGIRSELAVPLIDSAGNVVAVVNLESDELDRFGKVRTREIVTRMSCGFIRHVIALRNVKSGQCIFHPDIHGSDFRNITSDLCTTVAWAVDRDAARCNVWFVDKPYREMFVYDGYGTDIEYQSLRALSLVSATGKFLCDPQAEPVKEGDPRTDPSWVRPEKAQLLNLVYYCLAKLHHPVTGDACGSINMYLSKGEGIDDKERRAAARAGVIAISQVYMPLYHQFIQMRDLIASSEVASKVSLKRGYGRRSGFDEVLHSVRRVLSASGVSIFGKLTDCDTLRCVSTTGVESGHSSGGDSGAREIEYDMNQDQGSYTVCAAREKGSVIRMNRIRHRVERSKQNRNWPSGSMSKFVEILPDRSVNARRFMAVAVMAGDEVLGVIRVVRGASARPFTVEDEQTLKEVSLAAVGAFQRWKKDGGARAASDWTSSMATAIHSLRKAEVT